MIFLSPMQAQLGLTVHPRLFFFFSFFVITYNWPLHVQIHQNDLGRKLKNRFFFPFYDIIPGTLQKSVLFYSSSLCVQRMIEKWHYPSTKRSFRVSSFPSIVKYCWTALPWSQKDVRRWRSSSLFSSPLFSFSFFCSHCSLGQYWDMSGSLPGTWTGTDTPGEIRPVAYGKNAEIFRLIILCNLRAILKKNKKHIEYACLIYNKSEYERDF